MNIAVGHGTSFNKERIRIEAFGPDLSDRAVGLFLGAYRFGNLDARDLQMPADVFEELVRDGRILCATLFVGVRARAMWGIELRKDDDGPFMAMLFYMGGFHAGMVKEIADWCWRATCLYAAHEGWMGPVRFQVLGLPLWPKVLRERGIDIDRRGFIRERTFL